MSKTTEKWIEQAKQKHGNKYDYSKSMYIDWKTKICIICPEHGEFWQEPASHLRGYGCAKCSNVPNGLTIDERTQNFINKSNILFNNKYDYSKIDYKGKRIKICIICPEHGEFWQTPERHLICGCPKCAKENSKLNICEKNYKYFIEKAKTKYGNKYDYSKVNYKDSQTKVCITCPEHGEFWQTPEYHLIYACPKCLHNITRKQNQNKKLEKLKNDFKHFSFEKAQYIGSETPITLICLEHGEFNITPHSLRAGNGCPKCSKNHKSCTEEFIEKAKKIHGDKYDYSKVEYINALTKVCIICPEHGEFWQKPNSHLSKQGCPKCGHRKGKLINKNKQNFLEKSLNVHGNKYDYSKVEYVNNLTKVCIICPEHGEFWQVPSYHTSGNGCPKCKMSWLERDIMLYLEKHNIQYDYQKKFSWLGRQSLDFYLPYYNIAIECQGEQHFKPIKYFGGYKTFKQRQKRDKNKKELCEKEKINIFYYTDKKYEEYGYYDIDNLFEQINKFKKEVL